MSMIYDLFAALFNLFFFAVMMAYVVDDMEPTYRRVLSGIVGAANLFVAGILIAKVLRP